MMMNGPPKPEGDLRGNLAAAIAWTIACQTRTSFPGKQWNGAGIRQHGRAGDVIEHYRERTFKKAFMMLWSLQVVEPVMDAGVPSGWEYYFRLKMDVQDMPAFIRDRSEADALSINELLGSLIYVLSHFGLVPTSRRSLEVPIECHGIMDTLVKAGYAVSSGDAYVWTDDAAPAMQSIYAWNSDREDFEDLQTKKEELETEAALRTLTSEIEHALMEHPNDLIHFALIINRHWEDGRWHRMSEHKGETMLQGGFGLTKRFMEEFSKRFEGA